MTFLNPAILFGLLAASIPILLHLINLRKLKKVEFSTLSFLKELQKTRIKKIKLKQLILLLLRVLIVIFLVTAFARPAIKSARFAGSASTSKTTAVIIIDNTFSMSVVTEKGSYFNQAKQIAKKLISEFNEGDEISVILTGTETDIKPTANFSGVIKSINEAKISYISATINAAVVKAARIISTSTNFNKEIYLLSDLQKSRLYNSKNELPNFSKLLNPDTRFFVFPLSEKEAVNIGIVNFAIDNQLFEKDKTISFTAEVRNYSNQQVNNSVASLYLNGRRAAQQSIGLSAGETKQVSFETTLNQTGLVEARVELEEDDIPYDNKRFVSFEVPEKLSVLILYDKSADIRFIKLALDEGAGNIELTEKDLGQLSSLNLSTYDGVIIAGSENIGDLKAIDNLAENNGIILFPSSSGTLVNFRNLCAALKIPPPSDDIGKINSPENASSFEKTDYQSPVFTNLFEENVSPKIESPDIYRYYKTNLSGKGKTIISLIDGSSFLSEFNSGKHKILMFASAPVLSWNTFPLKGIFAPLLHKCVFYISAKTGQGNTYFTGESILADIRNNHFPSIEVERPDGTNEFLNSDSLTNHNFLEYLKSDIPGVYRFLSNSGQLDFTAVNVNPLESSTVAADFTEFEDYLKQISFEGNTIKISPDGDFNSVIYEARIGSELWRYFLIIVLLLALIEMYVARSSKKDLAHLSQ